MNVPKIEIIDPSADLTIVSVNKKDDPPYQQTTSNPSQAQEETWLKASFTSLMQSSDYFKARPSPNCPEGQELVQKGSVTIRIYGFDPKGVLIVLNILHLRHDQVPLRVSPELLTKVALVTDYFQCNQALAFIGNTWFTDCYSYPSSNTQLSPEYVFACHVFGMKDPLDKVISNIWMVAKSRLRPRLPAHSKLYHKYFLISNSAFLMLRLRLYLQIGSIPRCNPSMTNFSGTSEGKLYKT
jgi:hypothetical protein